MIVVDTSVLLSIYFGEPEAGDFARAIRSDPRALISIASLLEATLKTTRLDDLPPAGDLDEIVARLGLEPAPVDLEQGHWSRRGYATFGKGRRAPPAVLNFGDCFSYGLAKSLNAPLLFKGRDFFQTDVLIAEASRP